MKFRKARLQDVEGILQLQHLYLSVNMDVQEKKEGFVTTGFTVEQVSGILKNNGLFIAEDKGRIIAYLFGGSWQFFHQWEIFRYMCSRFPSLSFNGQPITLQNSFQYGPVCIHRDYRGQGIINELFALLRLELLSRYPLALTFINEANPRSMRAHIHKLGWTVIDRFEFNDNRYTTLAYGMHQEVSLDS